MEKAIYNRSIGIFITHMRLHGASDAVIINQLKLFVAGVRGNELHDDCIILIDGEVEVKE